MLCCHSWQQPPDTSSQLKNEHPCYPPYPCHSLCHHQDPIPVRPPPTPHQPPPSPLSHAPGLRPDLLKSVPVSWARMRKERDWVVPVRGCQSWVSSISRFLLRSLGIKQGTFSTRRPCLCTHPTAAHSRKGYQTPTQGPLTHINQLMWSWKQGTDHAIQKNNAECDRRAISELTATEVWEHV